MIQGDVVCKLHESESSDSEASPSSRIAREKGQSVHFQRTDHNRTRHSRERQIRAPDEIVRVLKSGLVDRDGRASPVATEAAAPR